MIFVRHPYSPPCLYPQGAQCKRTWICQCRKRLRLTRLTMENVARLDYRLSWRAVWRRNRCTAGKVLGFPSKDRVMSSAMLLHLRFTSCSSRITYVLQSTNNISFSLLNALLESPLSFFRPFFLSAGRRVVCPVSSHELTQTTHNSTWMVLPGARHAGKGLHHRVQSMCLRESVCARWKSSSRSSVNCQKPVDWISGWAGSVETPSLPVRTTKIYFNYHI